MLELTGATDDRVQVDLAPNATSAGASIECWIKMSTALRIWMAARSASEISSYRWTALSGTEDGLGVLVDLSSCNPAEPATMVPVNIVDSATGTLGGAAAVVQAPQPQQPQPQQVWVYQTPGVTPVGPMLGPAGVLCTDNDGATGATSPYLRMLDIQDGSVAWSAQVIAVNDIASPVNPSAVGMDPGQCLRRHPVIGSWPESG